MSQKVLPISLRLYKKKNWNSNWIVNKNIYSNFLFFDLEIRKYLNLILNTKDIKILSFNIKNFSKNIYIYVYLQKHPKVNYKIQYNNILNNLIKILDHKFNIKLFVINVKSKNFITGKNIKYLFNYFKKNHKINFNFKRIFYVFLFAFYTKNFEIISKLIKQNLKKKKIHKGYLKFINKILINFFNIYSNFLGYKIQIKGRINGSKRSQKLVLQEGKIPLNTLKNDIYYYIEEFNTPFGMCSLKLWFFFQKKIN